MIETYLAGTWTEPVKVEVPMKEFTGIPQLRSTVQPSVRAASVAGRILKPKTWLDWVCFGRPRSTPAAGDPAFCTDVVKVKQLLQTESDGVPPSDKEAREMLKFVASPPSGLGDLRWLESETPPPAEKNRADVSRGEGATP